MRKLIVSLVALVALSGAVASAAGTAAQRCAQAKNKAAAKKLAAKLKCWQKAIGAGSSTPDSTCIGTAEAKFNAAIAKIETKGGCDFDGDGPTIEAAVNAAVADIAGLTPATPYICCGCGGGLCGWALDASVCTFPCSPGAAGSVCDGATGNCISPPATGGGCCSNPTVVLGVGACLAVNKTTCETTYGGTFVPNAVCPPGGGPCVKL